MGTSPPASVSDRTFPLSEDDDLMALAIQSARKTLRQFFQAYGTPRADQKSFMLKIRWEQQGEVEHLWMGGLDASGLPLRGTVANRPVTAQLTLGQRLAFTPDRIVDWMYVEDGYLVGGYTTKAMRAGMGSRERAAFDAAAPFKFRD